MDIKQAPKLILQIYFGSTRKWKDTKDTQICFDNYLRDFLQIQRYHSLAYRLGAESMKTEVNTATAFLSHLIAKLNSRLKSKQLTQLRKYLNEILITKFTQHWYEDKPWKGQAYRCIRVNQLYRNDPVLYEAAHLAGIDYGQLKLPLEFTIWIDPKEVCCRFGESSGSIFTVASFKGEKKIHRLDHGLFRQTEESCINELKDHKCRNYLQKNKPRFFGS